MSVDHPGLYGLSPSEADERVHRAIVLRPVQSVGCDRQDRRSKYVRLWHNLTAFRSIKSGRKLPGIESALNIVRRK
jgi:hypothetical protein